MTCALMGSPGGASGKEPACQCRRHKRHGFDPWVVKLCLQLISCLIQSHVTKGRTRQIRVKSEAVASGGSGRLCRLLWEAGHTHKVERSPPSSHLQSSLPWQWGKSEAPERHLSHRCPVIPGRHSHCPVTGLQGVW